MTMAKRQSIEIKGVRLHQQPFPAAVRKGNMIFSSAVPGMDRTNGKVPDDAKAQIRNAFDNVKTLIENAGGTMEDIVKVQVFLKDRDMRPMVNELWETLFPDEHSRPVRHTIGGPLPANYVIQIEFIAVV
jgi:enamine deaminase RidA (YjgF/YER057c/UK114 family)